MRSCRCSSATCSTAPARRRCRRGRSGAQTSDRRAHDPRGRPLRGLLHWGVAVVGGLEADVLRTPPATELVAAGGRLADAVVQISVPRSGWLTPGPLLRLTRFGLGERPFRTKNRPVG